MIMQKKNLQISKIISSHFDLKDMMMSHSSLINKLGDVVSKIVNNGGCVFWCGNGGSAADAQHLAAELVGRFERERRAIKSIALNTDTSVMTALSNDYSYDVIFKRQLEALASKKDILIVFSTSGNSKNIISALNYCKKKSIKSISILGNKGGKAKKLSYLNLSLPIKETARIQEMHILIGHIICSIVEKNLKKR